MKLFMNIVLENQNVYEGLSPMTILKAVLGVVLQKSERNAGEQILLPLALPLHGKPSHMRRDSSGQDQPEETWRPSFIKETNLMRLLSCLALLLALYHTPREPDASNRN